MISKRSIIIHSLLSVFPFFVLCFLVPPSIASVQPPPGGVIKTFNAALLAAMKKADELGYRGRYELLEPVIRDTFALSYMAGQSTGRYWKKLTKDERESVIKVYGDWTIATYAGRFDGWSGEKFE